MISPYLGPQLGVAWESTGYNRNISVRIGKDLRGYLVKNHSWHRWWKQGPERLSYLPLFHSQLTRPGQDQFSQVPAHVTRWTPDIFKMFVGHWGFCYLQEGRVFLVPITVRKVQDALNQTELVVGDSVSEYILGKALADEALPALTARKELPHLGQSKVRKENVPPDRNRTLAGPQDVQSIHLTIPTPLWTDVFPI